MALTFGRSRPQNEPANQWNQPSMVMSAKSQQITFINEHLGPDLDSGDFSPKIIAYDHNCDNTAYPIMSSMRGPYVDSASTCMLGVYQP